MSVDSFNLVKIFLLFMFYIILITKQARIYLANPIVFILKVSIILEKAGKLTIKA